MVRIRDKGTLIQNKKKQNKKKSECENGGAATNGTLGVTGSAQRCLAGYEMFPEGTGSLRCSAVGRVVTVRYLTLAQGP